MPKWQNFAKSCHTELQMHGKGEELRLPVSGNREMEGEKEMQLRCVQKIWIDFAIVSDELTFFISVSLKF